MDVTTLDDRHTPDPTLEDTTTRLRVVLLLDVLDGRQERFLEAYEQIRHQVAGVPGHVSDQLCQSLGNSSQWLITSEWEGSEPFLEWVESAEHREMVEPLHGCVRDTTSLRFVIARETPEPAADAPVRKRPAARPDARSARPPARPGPAAGKTAGKAAGKAAGKSAGKAGAKTAAKAAPQAAGPRLAGLDPLPTPPLCSGGVVRHAITFTVKPGSEREVAAILSDYRSPKARVDDTTQLRRTSLFMHGNRVVRAVEVTGDLGNALRHVAAQPEVRAVEEAINPYLEEARDLTDASSARAFFARAALPAVGHVTSGPEPRPGEEITRHAFHYRVRPGSGPAAVRLLAELDAAAVADPGQPLAGSTVFQRDDVLVRLVDLREPHGDSAAGAPAGRAADELRRLLVSAEQSDRQSDKQSGGRSAKQSGARSGRRSDAASGDSVVAGLSYGGRAMDLLTDRKAQDA